MLDEFNNNQIVAVLSRENGGYFSAMVILEINGVVLEEPQVIYGVPNMSFKREFTEWEAAEKVYFANKWNGIAVIVFKYFDQDGNMFLSARTRFNCFLRGSDLYDKVRRCLGELDLSNLAPILSEIEKRNIQSISFELCGREQGSLVSYDFDLEMKPLFTTTMNGVICPFINASAAELLTFDSDFDSTCSMEELRDLVNRMEVDMGPFDYDADFVNSTQSKIQTSFLSLNRKYRDIANISEGYFYDRFAIEGMVMYVLDSDNNLVNRSSLFKIKPGDTFKSHIPIWDSALEGLTFEALDKIFMKMEEPTEESMRAEIEISEEVFDRFKNEIMNCVQGIPNPYEEREGNLHMIVMMGVPGSGKSTVSYQLQDMGWVRVNQDDLGNRKRCEAEVKKALKQGKSVVVDRCNFDVSQRRTWVKIASTFNVATISCIHLKIDPEICKKRLHSRENHPTIKNGDEGSVIIDKFRYLLTTPLKSEGFTTIATITDPSTIPTLISTISTIHIKI